MTADHDRLRALLGPVGAWTFTFDDRGADRIAADVAAIERVGFPSLWIPEGGGSSDVLTNLGWALGSSERLTMASGIANISAREPEVLGRGADFLTEAYGGRLVLGIGVGQSTADGMFSLIEVECLGGCVNAPILQVNDDFYEDLDGPATEALLDALRAGTPPQPGSVIGRQASMPVGGKTTLTEVPAPAGQEDGDAR